ncbi:MAG: hypothetical protein ACJ8NR_14090 [Sulfurifustis sp.]
MAQPSHPALHLLLSDVAIRSARQDRITERASARVKHAFEIAGQQG